VIAIVAAMTLAIAGALPPTAKPCVLQANDGAARVRARCDEVQVPEQRTASGAPQGEKLIGVGFAILEAKSQQPAKDPVVFLAGGPGQSSTAQAPLVAQALASVRRERHLVFFDARGTGRSSPIECKDPRPRAERAKLALFEVPELRDACLASAPLDPRSITTEQIARDLDLVREALGAEQLTLVGGSYGTRLALTYDALFPGRVRALVLDGVAPASMIIGVGLSEDAIAALTAADTRCEASSRCQKNGRSLVDIVRAARDRLAVFVDVPHPRTGIPTAVEVDGKAIVTVVRMLLYAEEGVAMLPPILRALDAGDLRPIAAQVLSLEAGEREINPAMQMAVLCAEDVPFYPDGPGDQDLTLPDVREEMRKICAGWPHASLDRAIHTPRASQTPALLLSGSNDPVTPPHRAEDAKASLSRAVHVVIGGASHGVFFRGCAPELVSKFIESADPTVLDTSCASKMGPMPVFSDAMGP
jgi:pimeloyl-ACP methyl ester carboxylesterase